MKHTAQRLTAYAVNKVIHVNNIKDVALKRLATDKRVIPLIRQALKDIDEQLELLVSKKGTVDSKEKQLKRHIQYHYGTTVNLSELRKKNTKYYLRLFEYGSPPDVIRGWGLDVTYNERLTEEELLATIDEFKDEQGVVRGVTNNEKLYHSLYYRASKEGKSIKDYLTAKGIQYRD